MPEPAVAAPAARFQSIPGQILRNSVFLGFHSVLLLPIWVGWSWQALALCAATYMARIFIITGAYHRYFSHKSYKTSRPFQFFLGLCGVLCVQKGPLWWAAHHRHHHAESDQLDDVHSPRHRGFWYAHMWWITSGYNDHTRWDKIPDLARYPELRWLNSYHLVPGIVAVALMWYFLGAQLTVWGALISTVILWHGTFTINSFTHIVGKRVYATTDDSRNSMILALITFGEGWHNNHHYYQSSAHQGFHWWQIDITWYILCALEKVGLIWGVKRAPQSVVEGYMGKHDYLIERRGDVPVIVHEKKPASASASAPAPAPEPVAVEATIDEPALVA